MFHYQHKDIKSIISFANHVPMKTKKGRYSHFRQKLALISTWSFHANNFIYIYQKIYKMCKQLFIMFILMLSFISATVAYSMNNMFNHVDDTDLLSVYCIDQDDEGQIWFCTDTRLFRYDGYRITAYPCPWGDMHANCMHIRKDRIYIGTNVGLVIYDRLADTFSYQEQFAGQYIMGLAAYGSRLFIATEHGLRTLEPDTGRLENPAADSRIPSIFPRSLDIKGHYLYVGTTDGMCYVINVDDMSMETQHSLIREDIGLKSKVVTSIKGLQDNKVMFGTYYGLGTMDINTGDVRILAYLNVAKTLTEGLNGEIYTGTDNGLHGICPDSGNSVQLMVGVIYCTFIDKDGGIWIGSDSGLHQTAQRSIVKTIKMPHGSEDVWLSSSFRDSRGRLWTTSNKGLFLTETDGTTVWFNVDDDTHHLPHNVVRDVIETQDGLIVIASDMGFLVYDEKEKNIKRHQTDSGDSGDNWIYDLQTDGAYYWMATYGSLIKMKGGRMLRRFTIDGANTHDFAQTVCDSKGRVLVLMRNQTVYELDHDADTLKLFDLSPLSVQIADQLLMDSRDVLWIASRNELMSISPDGSKKVTKVGIKTTDHVRDMADDGERIIGMLDSGMFILYKSSLETVHFDTGHRYSAIYRDPANGRILLLRKGCLDQISIQDIESKLLRNDHPARITEILVNDIPIPHKNLHDRHVALPYGENDIKISLSNFDYSDEVSQRFIYSMSHRGRTWEGGTQGNELSLSALWPGKYRISFSSDGLQDSASDSLMLVLGRPWYLSIPMLALYILFSALLVIWLFNYIYLKKSYKIEQEKKESIIKQAKEKEDFFVTVAHEFKTPLSLVIAPLSRLISAGGAGASQQLLKMAQENALKLNAMIHNSIGFYRGEQNISESVMLADTDFSELAQSIVSSFSESYKGLEFVVDLHPENMVLSLDPTKMETILNNLISNSCKYTEEGGSVILSARYSEEKEQLEISVSDTGIGIPEKEIPFIFQRYFESSRTKEFNNGSTGVGLSIIKNYVDILNGTVTVSSDESGTTFNVIIPCKSAAPNKADTAEIQSAEVEKPTVVLVEDNLQMCSFLESVLSAEYRFISVHNGKNGLKLCKEVMPDLIISDVMMPVMDGLVMCREIRKFVPLKSVPIILLTAKDNKDTERQSISLNIDAFIPKPFDVQILQMKIRQLLGNRSRIEDSIRMEMLANPEKAHELSQDELYLQRVTKTIEEHIDDTGLNVDTLCRYGNFLYKQLYRKVKQLTGMSPVEYIRTIRLKKAALMFQNGNYTVAEVMYNVGFSSMSYFCRAFTSEYGMTPSAYLKEKRKKIIEELN